MLTHPNQTQTQIKLQQLRRGGSSRIQMQHTLLKGGLTAFFLCMIVFMGCNITCIRGFSFL